MHTFLESAWFPFCIAIILAGVTTAAYALLEPNPIVIGNQQIADSANVAGWALGGVVGLLSWMLAGILNRIRRIVRLRRVALLHPIVALLSIAPWGVLAWQLTGEPRYTPIARAIIDFGARPMLWGSLIAAAICILSFLILLLPRKAQ